MRIKQVLQTKKSEVQPNGHVLLVETRVIQSTRCTITREEYLDWLRDQCEIKDGTAVFFHPVLGEAEAASLDELAPIVQGVLKEQAGVKVIGIAAA